VRFISTLAIALGLSLTFGFADRTADAHQDSGVTDETPVNGKADFLLRESYRAAGLFRKLRTATLSSGQNGRQAEDELHGFSKIIDVKPQKGGSVGISVAALLLS